MPLQEKQNKISRQLLGWSTFSIIAGIFLSKGTTRFWQGFASQAIGWGVIDALIAIIGQKSSNRLFAANPPPEKIAKETKKLRNLLWFNTGLDILYMLGGHWVYKNKGHEDERWQGIGAGIFVQGTFLFFFDLIHAKSIKK